MPTLGKGGRAKNGQYRRKSKFVPCVQCGQGTTFIYCLACQERNQAQKSAGTKSAIVTPTRLGVTIDQAAEPEPSGGGTGAGERSHWCQGVLF